MAMHPKDFLEMTSVSSVIKGTVVGLLAVQVAGCAAIRSEIGSFASGAPSRTVAQIAPQAPQKGPEFPAWLLRESVGAAPTMAMINSPWSVTKTELAPKALKRGDGGKATPRTVAVVPLQGRDITSNRRTKPVELAMLTNSDPEQVAQSLRKISSSTSDNDATLAKQRGRYLVQGPLPNANVVYFGVQMTTTAKDLNSGYNATAGAQFSMSGSSVINQTWTVQEGEPNFNTAGQSFSGTLNNSGVGQIVQVAGNGNGGTNTTIINVTRSFLQLPSAPTATATCDSTSCLAQIDPGNGSTSLGSIVTRIAVTGLNAANIINEQGITQKIAVGTVGAVVNNILTLDVQLGKQPNIAPGFVANVLGMISNIK